MCLGKVEQLREGQVYEWRVRAVNKAGRSEPSEQTDKHKAKHRNRKWDTNKLLKLKGVSGNKSNCIRHSG